MSKDNRNMLNEKKSIKNGYVLSQQWTDFAKMHPEKIKPIHYALYYYCIDLNNRLFWKEVFGLPTVRTMKMIGIKDRKYYRNGLKDLENWGFIKKISKSLNQYQSNKFSLLIRDNKEELEINPIIHSSKELFIKEMQEYAKRRMAEEEEEKDEENCDPVYWNGMKMDPVLNWDD